MKNNIHIATVLAFGLMAVSTQESVAQSQIVPVAGSARQHFHVCDVSHMFDQSRESGNQAMAGDWDPPSSEMWPYADTDTADIWVMFDLGQEYNLTEIRLWNLDITHGDAGTEGWHVKNMSIHVAGEGAVMPSTFLGLGHYFTDGSWSNVWDGDLAHGPVATTISQGQLLDPELTFDATGINGIRYVAIDVDSNYAGDQALTGLQHIQVIGSLPPTHGTLMYGR